MLFSNKVLRYLSTVALLAVPAAGNVEYFCCDSSDKCEILVKTKKEDLVGCAAFYLNDFPDNPDDIRALCSANDNGMTYGCLDETQIDQQGNLLADYYCCDDESDCDDESSDNCDWYYGSVPLKDLETACVAATTKPLSDGSPVDPPDITCKVIVAAFGGMDPHFKTWGGEWYNFHGMCDLVMLDVPDFGTGQGLTIHARTKGRYDYSYIESVAIKIGDNVFQLSSYGDYILDGVSQAELPATIGGYTIRQTTQNGKESVFEIQISKYKTIELSTFKDMVSIRTPVLDHSEFRTSKGLFGAFPSGKLVGRDGTTIFTDHNEFGQEWQVLDSEPKLFQDVDHFPQHPHDKCVLPDPTKDSRRRLGETVATEAAESACSHWGYLKEMCVMDVMATGDIEIAQSNHQKLM